ncbi:MAG: DUF452 family protein [Calditerrivibrio sp.]|nr:DUF452 family protein [Calditerrivibrio sp.]
MKVVKKKRKNEELLVFFSGYMMKPEIYEEIDSSDLDIFFIHDYRDFELDSSLWEDVASYFKVYLVAFSFGVSIASSVIKQQNVNIFKSIAVNGTLKPVDDFFGIPESIFLGTLNNLSEESLDRFYRRVFGKNYSKLKHLLSYDLEIAKEELKNLKVFVDETGRLENIYNIAIISENDKIFPPTNQMSFWQNELDFMFVDEDHFPFFRFKSWRELLNAQ